MTPLPRPYPLSATTTAASDESPLRHLYTWRHPPSGGPTSRLLCLVGRARSLGTNPCTIRDSTSSLSTSSPLARCRHYVTKLERRHATTQKRRCVAGTSPIWLLEKKSAHGAIDGASAARMPPLALVPLAPAALASP
jgi:hypothetical protein